jgi:DNA-3-methyladenine glycosylase
VTRDELDDEPAAVAVALLGATLRSGAVAVRLLEVEAYDGVGDAASHAARGPRTANRTMFGPAGHLYVYLSYGIHDCANVVCRPAGQGAAVLVRAAEVLQGLELVLVRRGRPVPRGVLDGPGKLCQGLGITRALDGADLFDPASPVRLEDGEMRAGESVVAGPRIGLTKEVERPWRFRLLAQGAGTRVAPKVGGIDRRLR